MVFSDILEIVTFGSVPEGNIFFEGIDIDNNTQSDFTKFRKLGDTGLELNTTDLFDYEDDALVFVIKETSDIDLKFTLTVKITDAHQPVIEKIKSMLLDGTTTEQLYHFIRAKNGTDQLGNEIYGWWDDWNIDLRIAPYPTEGEVKQ